MNLTCQSERNSWMDAPASTGEISAMTTSQTTSLSGAAARRAAAEDSACCGSSSSTSSKTELSTAVAIAGQAQIIVRRFAGGQMAATAPFGEDFFASGRLALRIGRLNGDADVRLFRQRQWLRQNQFAVLVNGIHRRCHAQKLILSGFNASAGLKAITQQILAQMPDFQNGRQTPY